MKHSDGIGSTFGVFEGGELLNLRMTSDPSLSVQRDSSPMKTAQSIDIKHLSFMSLNLQHVQILEKSTYKCYF